MLTGLNRHQGLSLVEVLISLFLTTLIIVGVIQVFMTTQQVYFEQQGIARVQENARSLQVLLQKAIRQSGRMGCQSLGDDLTMHVPIIINADHYGFSQPYARGVSLGFLLKNPAVPLSFFSRIEKHSDILWIKEIKKKYAIQDIKRDQGTIRVKGSHRLKKGDLIILSDCSQLEILKIFEAKPHELIYVQPPILQQRWPDYVTPTLGKLGSTLYYVGKTNRFNGAGDPVYSLYSTDLNGRTTEWVEGVDKMMVRYGIIVNGQLDYVAVEKIKKWSQVKCIRVNVLLNSIEDCLRKPQQDSPQDKRFRRWWQYEWRVS